MSPGKRRPFGSGDNGVLVLRCIGHYSGVLLLRYPQPKNIPIITPTQKRLQASAIFTPLG